MTDENAGRLLMSLIRQVSGSCSVTLGLMQSPSDKGTKSPVKCSFHAKSQQKQIGCGQKYLAQVRAYWVNDYLQGRSPKLVETAAAPRWQIGSPLSLPRPHTTTELPSNVKMPTQTQWPIYCWPLVMFRVKVAI